MYNQMFSHEKTMTISDSLFTKLPRLLEQVYPILIATFFRAETFHFTRKQKLQFPCLVCQLVAEQDF